MKNKEEVIVIAALLIKFGFSHIVEDHNLFRAFVDELGVKGGKSGESELMTWGDSIFDLYNNVNSTPHELKELKDIFYESFRSLDLESTRRNSDSPLSINNIMDDYT